MWKFGLEWCESNGNPNAINPKDRDGTRSLGAYQFKPETLISYAQKYHIKISDDILDYDSQSAVIDQMILHRDEINWAHEFPVCAGQKLGSPPA